MIDCDSRGVRWKSAETLSIPYRFLDRDRTYHPDFICGNRIIELKPERLISSPLVMAKTKAAELYCKQIGKTFEIYDVVVDDIAIRTAYDGGLVRFARDYEERFLSYRKAS